VARARRDEMTKRERQRLTRMVEKHLAEHGGRLVADEPRLPRWVVETKYGPLEVRPDGANIFCRFTERKGEAPSLLRDRVNPYSGKCNYHFVRQTAEQAFALFEFEMASVLFYRQDQRVAGVLGIEDCPDLPAFALSDWLLERGRSEEAQRVREFVGM